MIGRSKSSQLYNKQTNNYKGEINRMNKKTIAIVLSLALIFSSLSGIFATFADNTLSTDAQACATLGMLKGTTGVVDATYTATQPTRLQAAIMMLRLKGLENEALAFTGTDNFADVTNYAWIGGRNIMAYLKAHPELGWIGDNGNFKPNEIITAQQYYKVMLESLGYKQNTSEVIGDFTYANVLSFAASKGLTKVSAVSNFTVNDLAVATIEALKAAVKGSTGTLSAALVQNGKMDQAKAIAAGVYTAPVVDLAVTSVKPLNLVEVSVAFNAPVDADTAEAEANYSIDGHVVKSAELQADGQTVLLTLDASGAPADAVKFDQQEDFTIVIDGVKSADLKSTMTDYETATATAFDATVPTAQKIELVGPKTVKVTYNEPIENTASATVDINDGIYGADVAAADASNVVTVDLGSSLDSGTYNFVISGVKDFAGYSSMKEAFTLNYQEVKTAPVATVTSADQTEVVVEFNRPVTNEDGTALKDLAAADLAKYFYHSYSSYNPDTVTTTDSQEFTLSFTTNPLPEGNVKFVVDYNANDSVITDEWGNAMADNSEFALAIAADKDKPAITNVEVAAQDSIVLHFSEGLDKASAETSGNYVVLDKNGDEVAFNTPVYDATNDDYTVTLGFDSNLEGAYTVEVSNVADDSIDANEITTVTKAFTVADEVGPDLTALTGNVVAVQGDDHTPSYIYVTYPEDMMTASGQYSVLNKDNYMLSGNDLASADKVELFSGKDRVKITIADGTTPVIGETLSVARVADLSGNKSALLSRDVVVGNDVPPVVTAIRTIDKKTIEITVDQPLTSVVASGFLVSRDGGVTTHQLAGIQKYSVNDDNETVILGTLYSTQQDEDSAAVNVQVSVVASKIKSETGKYMAAGATGIVATDGFAPSIIATDAIVYNNDNTISVKFDEALDATYAALYGSDLVVKNPDGDVLVNGVDYTTTVAGDTITVTLAAGYATGNYKIYSTPSITYIRDAAGNKANAFTDVITLKDIH